MPMNPPDSGLMKNPAWNDPTAGIFLRALALLGGIVLVLFNPQVRVDRRGFAVGLAGWAAAAAAAYLLMDFLHCEVKRASTSNLLLPNT